LRQHWFKSTFLFRRSRSYQSKSSSASKTERARNLEVDYLDLAYERGEDASQPANGEGPAETPATKTECVHGCNVAV
jgi:hypothetical protein